jgi:ribokinase
VEYDVTAKIVVVGSFNADLTSYMARMPRPGETVHGRKFVTGPGGKGSNQAVAAARLGAEVTFVGRIGQDVFAPYALNMWAEEGIRTEYVVQDPENATGVAPIFVDDSGENSIVVVLGANLAVSTADVDAAAGAIRSADILLVQLEIDYETVAYALQVAKRHGVHTILNPAPAGHLPAEVLKLADYITPNETELEILADRPGASLQEAAAALLARDGQTVIVTLGAQGAQYVRRDGSGRVPAYQVDVIDTTGAGDAFNGGLAVALAEGNSLEQAINFANAAAALCVTRRGAAASMAIRAEVEAFFASA